MNGMRPVVNVGSDDNGFPKVVSLTFTDRVPEITTYAQEIARIPRYPWQIIVGTGWPMGMDAEEEFKLDATVAAKGKSSSSWRRSDISVMMAAMRNSATYESMALLLPGVKPERILGAYRHLESGLRHATLGWEAIVNNPSNESIEEHAVAAAMVLPAAVSRLIAASEETRADEVQRINKAISDVRSSVDTIHSALEALEDECVEGIELGRLLFAAGSECLYSHPMFLPSRVSELSGVAVDLMAWPQDGEDE